VTPRRIESFLRTLGRELGTPARGYLTGAAAAAFWGRVRPSLDVDIGIQLFARSGRSWEHVQAAVDRTTRLTGISASVAEDIDRWGMITLLDYRRSARPLRRFGAFEVRLLHPVNWSIGKLTRYLDPDVQDVVEVFRRQKVPWTAAARTWGRALRASPASTTQFRFRQNVEAFAAERGRATWGRSFEGKAFVAAFHRAAKISLSRARDPRAHKLLGPR
jgi:hypothetical protein